MKIALDSNIGVVSIHSLQTIEGALQTVLDLDVFNANMKVGVTLSEFINQVGDSIVGYPFIDVDNNTIDDTQLFYSTVYQKWYAAEYSKKWGPFREAVEAKMETLSSEKYTSVPWYRNPEICSMLALDVSAPNSVLVKKMAELESLGDSDMNNVRNLLTVYSMFVHKLGIEARQIAFLISQPKVDGPFNYVEAHQFITEKVQYI